MGCSSSKRVDAAAIADVYRPAPASFTVFDINSIQEPWIVVDSTAHQQKPTHVPAKILEKLNSLEAAEEPAPPHSWDEVSKALEDLKPTFQPKPVTPKLGPIQQSPPPAAQESLVVPKKPNLGNSKSFHTLEELDAKLSPKPTVLRKTESTRSELKKSDSKSELRSPLVDGAGEPAKSVKENIFIVRDRLEREKEGKLANIEKILAIKRDPLSEYPQKCPPGGADTVVIYTTSLQGVRRTYEDCNRVRAILELHRVAYDERDVSFHGGFLSELKELLAAEEEVGPRVPRVFIKGRYVGGAEEVAELNDSGRLGRILCRTGVERGVGRLGCQGCGGARFVPCLECGGSCKVAAEGGDKVRCTKCNENGLVHCPTCF
ncbi:Thioredoxin-like fold containing protein [Parasponia andersonii]|uniref:Thioredoxin-like fold containing protein n=1 Tax=Parasponia andersonii TaxID=3476 RepID=A0A2P5ACE5_PARAD|nr:Thioredoxin-like fold containing protein [Parasponia andersonii]